MQLAAFDKSAWGDGPWQQEPDRVRWDDPATGYPCLILRSDVLGVLCGYVGLLPEHPLHGKDFMDIDVQCHGGLTFARPSSGMCDDMAPKTWLLGFDCGHCDDFCPAMEATLRQLLPDHQPMGGIYRDLAYVTREVTKLAQQLKAMER